MKLTNRMQTKIGGIREKNSQANTPGKKKNNLQDSFDQKAPYLEKSSNEKGFLLPEFEEF